MNIFFDLDGTLLNIHKRLYRLYVEFARQVNSVPLSEDKYFEKKAHAMMERDIAKETFSSRADEYIEWKKDHIEETSYLKLDTMFLGVIEMLAALNKTHKLFILTSRVNRVGTLEQLEKNGIMKFMTEVITVSGGDPVELKTAGLRDAAIRYHLDLKQTALVGDTEIEFGVGKTLGIRCISVSYGLRSEEYFHALGQKTVIKSVRELQTILVQ
jgi:phosphoglycolate phosphatase-like HAD superfamily hydrolase